MTANEGTLKRPPRSRGAVQRLRIVVIDGPDRGKIHEPAHDGPVAIGASQDNEVVLGDRTVSRYHLEIARSPEGIMVRDLGSSNGTFAGDVRIERAIVRPGARLRLGDTILEVGDGAIIAARDEVDLELPGVIGTSRAMRDVAAAVDRLAHANISVLIEGETGTGKELVARALHERGPRRAKPFVVVDCGSLPATLIASELFGHERGAFTGADRRHGGAFERADGGTVFLDEIGELPLLVQPSLLGVLERRRFRRVGGTSEIDVDVRVVSATHRDLRAEVNESTFRADLYFRLSVARIVLPPLRERPEDIEPLVAHFVEEATGASEIPFGAATMDALRGHRWSGNVRELRNVVEAALALGGIRLDDRPAAPDARAAETSEVVPYREARATAITDFERAYLSDLIQRCEGNASEAARRARMDRPYLLSLLRRHSLR